MAFNVGYMPFPEFFSMGNNYKYCSISGMFPALGVPRKVVDTFLEASTHVGPIIGYVISRIFSAWCNNSKDCSISGVFSALGAPRKVVDTFFESS